MSSPEGIIMEERVAIMNMLRIKVGNKVALRDGRVSYISQIDLSHRTAYPIIVKDIGSYTIEGKASIYYYGREHPDDIVDWNYKETVRDILNNTTTTTGFIKHDKGKPLVSLVEPDFILGLAEVMSQGAKEYGRDNWKECEEPHRYLDALLRHTLSYWKGDKIDDKSGKSHLFHIAFNAMALHYLDTKLKD